MEELVAMIKILQYKLDEQTNEIRDMKQGIPQIINNNIDTKFENLELKYNTLEQKIEEQGRRIQQLEKTNRKKNLIFFGMEESESNYFDLQNNILKIINQVMKINSFSKENIGEVTRLGKKQDTNKIRPTIVTLTTMGMKIELLKNKKRLEGTTYYIKEDYPIEILEERKKLSTQLIEERNKGRKAFLRYNKLIIIPEDVEKNHNNKTQDRNQNKRNLSESPEINYGNTNFRKPGPKKQFKMQNSGMHKYMIAKSNKETPNSSLTLANVTNTMLPLQSNKN